ncbi:MAG: DegT/DnrJ/EryC1/StrS family aminotransferase [Acidobacteriota bacterium]|nr:DegT/DnrJ/EryC1/StrS family aminotransferase [Acidobacteriota bacterium]
MTTAAVRQLGLPPSKTSWRDLAVFGSQATFAAPLHVGRPNIGNRERFLDRVNNVLDRGWFTNNGPLVQEFEAKVAAYLGVAHCIAICNGTIALEIAIRALGLKGEVIVPSFTFVATAHALQWQEITPVFCDVDPASHSIDPRVLGRLITPRTSGIIGVHLWGQGCAIDQLSEIARERNLALLFDASHAFGASHAGRMIGNFGRAEIFSFHATKFFNTLEGGAVVTNDDELAAKIRLMKNFGFAGYDRVVYIGTNGKMNEVSAAMGLTCLESIDCFIAANRSNYEQYRAELAGLSGIKMYEYDRNERRNFQYAILEVDSQECGLTRDLLLRILHAENVLARRYFYPGCHRMEPYRSYFPSAGLLLSETEQLSERVLALPTGKSIGSDEISAICQLIRLGVRYASEIKNNLCSQS